MNCVIIDDNKMARTVIKHLALEVTGLTVAGECSNSMEAYNLTRSQPVDLLFLESK
ncbi:MAG: hypothetical protein ABI707_05895 [Ferruginibacter sp.]